MSNYPSCRTYPFSAGATDNVIYKVRSRGSRFILRTSHPSTYFTKPFAAVNLHFWRSSFKISLIIWIFQIFGSSCLGCFIDKSSGIWLILHQKRKRESGLWNSQKAEILMVSSSVSSLPAWLWHLNLALSSKKPGLLPSPGQRVCPLSSPGWARLLPVTEEEVRPAITTM